MCRCVSVLLWAGGSEWKSAVAVKRVGVGVVRVNGVAVKGSGVSEWSGGSESGSEVGIDCGSGGSGGRWSFLCSRKVVIFQTT